MVLIHIVILMNVIMLTNVMTPLNVQMKIQDAKTLVALLSVRVLTITAMSMVFVLITTNVLPLTVLTSASVSQLYKNGQCHQIWRLDTRCDDMNECLSDDECLANEFFENTDRSYPFTCVNGYSGNGTECHDDNGCLSTHNCDINAELSKIDSSFTCSCN